MEWEFVAMVAPVVAGLVGVWVNLNSTVARLKSRVIQLEIDSNEIKSDMKELLASVHKIELMLASCKNDLDYISDGNGERNL